MTKLAINGYGRIGRAVFRALHESPLARQLQIVAINEPADLDSMAYLTRFDSTHGRFPGTVTTEGAQLMVNGRAIAVSHAANPEAIDWAGTGADVLIECSGCYTRRAELERFLNAGCPRLLLSQPGHSAADVDGTVIFGINHQAVTGSERLLSAASCTTQAAVPVLALIDAGWGIEHALLTTLHSVMNDQPLIDGYHASDLRLTRSAMQSMIPVETGLARGIERLLPQLAGKVEAKAIRMPVANVSAIDLTIELTRSAAIPELHAALAAAASGPYANRLGLSDDPHASIDFNHSPLSAIVDITQTRAAGKRLVNFLIWFDNEWGYANRLLELAAHWVSCHQTATVNAKSPD